LLPGTSQAIGKRLAGRINGNSVAPEFTPKRNSALSDNRGRRSHDAVRLEIGEKHVTRTERANTCLRTRAVVVLTAPAWLPGSDSGGIWRAW
jgi:hypothetical protein